VTHAAQETAEEATAATAAMAGFSHIGTGKDQGHHGHKARYESSRKHC
jgi:hypothetical protein